MQAGADIEELLRCNFTGKDAILCITKLNPFVKFIESVPSCPNIISSPEPKTHR